MSLESVQGSTDPAQGTERAATSLRSADIFIWRVANSINTLHLILGLFLVAFLFRAVYALIAVAYDPMLNGDPLMGDAASYDRIARSLMAGGGYGEQPHEPSAFWPPLYPAFLAGLYSVFSYDLMLARITNAAIGALVPVLIYLIGIRLFDRRVALLAAVGAVGYPLLIVLGAWVIPDGPYIVFVCLILLTMIEIQRHPRTSMYLALGVILGLAYLLKPVTAFFLPFLVPWFLFSLRSLSFGHRFRAGVVTAFVLVLVLAPWTVRNQVVLGSPIVGSSNGGYTFYGANNPHAFGGHYEHFPERIPELSEGAEQMQFYRQGVEWILSDPSAYVSVTVSKFRRLASPLSISSSPDDLSIPGETLVRIGYTAFLLLVLAGVVILRNQLRATGLLLVPILGVLLSTAVFYGDARYTMPAVPSLLLLAAVSIVWIWEWLANRSEILQHKSSQQPSR
jgi:4-amino-4-deoxy-L-arabinose transferase-like glycosyltransferase